MPKYCLIEKESLEQIINSLKGMIENGPELTIASPKEKTPAEIPPAKMSVGRGRGRKQNIADVIYNKVTLTKFTPRQAFEIISPYVPVQGDRFMDSIRVALKRDKRFSRGEDGLYFKAK